MKHYKGLIIVISCVLLEACSAVKVEKMHKEVRADRSEIERIVAENTKYRALKPKAERIRIERGKEWLYNHVQATTSSLGLRQTVAALSQGAPVVFNIPQEYNPIVSSSRYSRTVKDHFDSIEIQANVGISVSYGTVIVSDTKTKQYAIPVFGSSVAGSAGLYNVQLATDNLQKSGSAGNVNNFANAVIGSINPYKEIMEMVQSAVPNIVSCGDVDLTFLMIKQKEILDCFTISSTGNTLTITGKPQHLARFDTVYEKWVLNATRQAHVTIKTFEIDVTDLAQQQLDVNFVRNSLVQSSLRLNSGGLIDVLDHGGSLTFEFLDDSLYEGGTQGVLQALNKISDVSTIDTHEIQLHNNRLHTERDFGTTRYLEQLSNNQVSSGSQTLSTPTATFKEISTGQALNILPTISEDSISMHIVINSAEIDRFDSLNIGDGLLQSTLPQDNGRDSVFDITLKDNQMVMVSSSMRKVLRVEKGKTDYAPIVGDARSGEKRFIQRLYLIQGRITDS